MDSLSSKTIVSILVPVKIVCILMLELVRLEKLREDLFEHNAMVV